LVSSGATTMMVNSTFQKLFADDSIGLDFSSLSPYELGGFADMLSNVWGEGLGEVIMKAPGGQLLLSDSGRVGAAWNSLMRHFVPISEGWESPESILDTVNQIAKIGSGWNNLTKAYVAYQTGMAM